MTKTCFICKIEKSLDCFGKAKQNKDGYKGQCKDCRKIYEKAYRIENPKKIVQVVRDYYLKNRKEILISKKKYYLEHKDEKLKYNKIYTKRKRKENPQFKLSANLRGRLNMAVKKEYKAGSAVKDLGCSIKSFKIYLESLFLEGMSWENYGPKSWHLDHNIPLSYFDLTNREQFLKACHYTNIRPMWALDNLKKGDKTHA